MRAPGFWWRRPGIEANLLRPVGRLYGAVTAWRMLRPGLRSTLPVICAGNFVAGGAGKTPFAIELARRLTLLGARPAFLTRGHGGSLAGPVLVDPATHTALEVGDEALLLAARAPTVVARSRAQGAKLAEASGASAIVMDDGLQHASLAKDLAFAVADAETGVGNGLCVPAGPLRAPLAVQWGCVQALVLVGEMGDSGKDLAREAARRGLPVIAATLVPDPEAARSLRGRRVLAFAGIGRPSKFFATLRALGAGLVGERGFPDHHRFAPRELADLAAQARAGGAVLVTTEKDMARIGAAGRALLQKTGLRALPVHMRIADSQALDELLDTGLARRVGAA